MKYFLLTILLSGLMAFSAAAQQNLDREVYPEQASIEHNDAVKSFSSDYVTAFENNMQNLWGLTGSAAVINVDGSQNLTILSQRGNNINGLINIDGSGNQTNMEQAGTNLFSILNIQGNANQFDMTQQGNNLYNQFHILGSGANMQARQTNSGMNYRQSGTGTIPLSIQQQGQAKPIIIRNY